MHLTLIKNPDESKAILYKIARVVYAETLSVSLPVVEAVCSMISNLCLKSKQELEDIIKDKAVFESLNKESLNHKFLSISASESEFQMCLRVVQRMANGTLKDSVFGATMFHREENMPSWATSKGYVRDIDGLLFYL